MSDTASQCPPLDDWPLRQQLKQMDDFDWAQIEWLSNEITACRAAIRKYRQEIRQRRHLDFPKVG